MYFKFYMISLQTAERGVARSFPKVQVKGWLLLQTFYDTFGAQAIVLFLYN